MHPALVANCSPVWPPEKRMPSPTLEWGLPLTGAGVTLSHPFPPWSLSMKIKIT